MVVDMGFGVVKVVVVDMVLRGKVVVVDMVLER